MTKTRKEIITIEISQEVSYVIENEEGEITIKCGVVSLRLPKCIIEELVNVVGLGASNTTSIDLKSL